jgi:hypothetical protein
MVWSMRIVTPYEREWLLALFCIKLSGSINPNIIYLSVYLRVDHWGGFS